MALPGDEQLDFLEQTFGPTTMAQVRQEGAEKIVDRSEAQRLLDEAERMMQMHGDTSWYQKEQPVVITLVTFGGIGELAAPGNTSVEGDNEKQTSEKITIGN
jgi:hypothetical protein